MKSTEFLQAAIDVQAERGKQYDKPTGERSMAATVSAFNCITGSMLEESDGWMFLGLLKLVRQSQNPEQYHHDSALDFVAYASLYAEAASEQCGQAEQDAHIGYKDEEPSHIQVGDKVVCLVGQQDMTEGRVYVVTRIGSGNDCAPFKVIDDVGDEWCLSRNELRKLGDAQ
jgi:hypothetical protein